MVLQKLPWVQMVAWFAREIEKCRISFVYFVFDTFQYLRNLIFQTNIPGRNAGMGAFARCDSSKSAGKEPTAVAEAREPIKTPERSFPSSTIFDNDLASSSDYSDSLFPGVAKEAFAKEAVEILMAPVDPADVEIKPGWWQNPLISQMDCVICLKSSIDAFSIALSDPELGE